MTKIGSKSITNLTPLNEPIDVKVKASRGKDMLAYASSPSSHNLNKKIVLNLSPLSMSVSSITTSSSSSLDNEEKSDDEEDKHMQPPNPLSTVNQTLTSISLMTSLEPNDIVLLNSISKKNAHFNSTIESLI